LVKPEITQEKISSVLNKTEYAIKKSQELRPGTKLKLLLAIVTQLDQDEEDSMRSLLIEKFALTPVDVIIRLMDFEGLQRIYAAD
jgi:hypothetical protein